MMTHTFFSSVRAVCAVLCMAAAVVLSSACGKPEAVPEQSERGTMRITSDPVGADVSILGKNIGVTPRTTNPVPVAMYIVKISKEGYRPTWIPVNVVRGRETPVEVKLEAESATVAINSDPAGAHVAMDGKDLGDAPVILPDLPLGTYTATVQMQGYSRREITWKVQNSRPVLINVPLMNNVGKLSVVSTPDTAAVEIDGKAYGNTPLSESLEQGQYKLKLTKTGYKPYEKIVTVKRDDETSESITLETLPGALIIDSNPSGAALFINDIDYGATPYTRASIEADTYTVKLVKEGYDTLEQEITVHPGEPFNRTFTLDPNTGSIVLSVNPPGMKVYLDGKFICRTEADGKSRDISKTVTLKDLSAGKHTVTVSHKKAEPSIKTLTVTVEKGKAVQAPRIDFWLPDTELILKNGSQYTGRLTDKHTSSNTKIAFRHSAGITSEYNKSDIRELIPLKLDEE